MAQLWRSRTSRFQISGARIGLFTVWLAAVGAMFVTAQKADAPAWWQAFLSGAALLTTTFLWQLEKEHQRTKEDEERRNLKAIIGGSVQALGNNAERLVVALDDDSELSDRKLKSLLREVEHRFLHLQTFSPYDRLGSFGLVQAVADVEVCCRMLLVFLEDAPSPAATGNSYLFTRFLPKERTAKNVTPIADDLVRRCENACRLLFAKEDT